jgi:DNA-binding LacI/PurR family transcriptional regulator
VNDSPKQSATLAHVAREADVSRTTAAKVLLGTGGDHVRVGEATRKRVEQAAALLDYRPNRAAQHLAGARTQTLGVLMDTVNAPVMNDRLAAIEREARRRGYRLLIGQVGGDIEVLRDYLLDFDGRGVEALFCLFDVTRGRALRLKPLLGGRRDVVLHGKPLDRLGHCVRVDTAQAIDGLVAHLLGAGRRRIGLQLENMNDALMGVRRKAFQAALQSRGEAFDPDCVWTARSESVIPSPQMLTDAIDTLVDRHKVDAIVASNDVWAVRLIQALKARGNRVPDDVAVTGYDNLDLATIIDPPLTTIDQQHDLYAKAAVDLLIAIASGAPFPQAQRTATIDPKLIQRTSA